MGGEMLKRREFMKISTIIAAGAVLPLTVWDKAIASDINQSSRLRPQPPFRLTGDKRTGCAVPQDGTTPPPCRY